MPLRPPQPFKTTIISLLGWFGVACVLGAYGFVSFGVLASSTVVYQLLNGVGATCLIIESAWRKDYPFTFLNVVWVLVALVVLVKILVF